MDGVRSMGMSPMSAKFMGKAARVAQTQAASVKDKKDLKQDDDSNDLRGDQVTLSNAGKKGIKDALHSGVMSELAENKKKDKKGGTGKASMFGGEEEVSKRGRGAQDSEEAGAKGQKVEEMDLDQKLQAMEIMGRDPKEIQGDVPQPFFETAKRMVEGQIKKGQPTGELTQLKSVETAPIELAPLRNVEIMPIHDSHNKPIPAGMSSGMGSK